MKYVFGLCEARHQIPVERFLFGNQVDPTDFDVMRTTAISNIPNDADEIDVYVTGLTAAMLAVADVCEMKKVGLTAYHFNRETGEYLPQRILSFRTCPFCGKRSSQYSGWYCSYCGAT